MKNLNNLTLLFAIFMTISIIGQEKIKGNREVTTTDRNISEFSKIEVIDNVTVEITYNDFQSVKVETDSNLQNSVVTEVNNGILLLKP